MRTHRLQTTGGQVTYETFGTTGPPVVALPGIGDTRQSYRALAPLLVAAGYTVYVMDLRGHGQSDTCFGSFTATDIGDDVVALLESLDLRDAVVIGNSIGAAAGAHASLASDRVGKLVSLSGFVDDPPRFGLLVPLTRVLFAWPWGVAVWGMARKTLYRTPPADFASHHAEVLTNLREPGRLAAMRAMLSASKASIASRLSDVTVPALILMGAQDPDFPDPAEEAKLQAERLGGLNHIVMIEQAGHYPQIERPDATAEAILAFLTSDVNDGA